MSLLKQMKSLSLHLASWDLEMRRVGRITPETRAKYLRQVHTFPGLLLSDLTTPKIRAWLEALEVGQPNRYRAAMSAFCSFLVREGLLPANPVREVPSARESTPRDRHLTPEEMYQVCQWLFTHRGASAAMFQALLVCTAADVESVLAAPMIEFKNPGWDPLAQGVTIHGTKTAARTRRCYITRTWEPLWQAFVHAEDWHPRSYALHRRDLQMALDALGISDYTMKDHRHTWAVQAFRDKIPLHAIANQLGHSSPAMALRVYGRHMSRVEDYR